MERPEMLHGKILHSPHAHARITSIDGARARALPGVHAVLTHHDLAPIRHSTAGTSWPELCPYDALVLDPHLRYVGDWVAFAAAETPELAEQALELVDVRYEVLPAVFDALEAMAPGAPQLHEPDRTHPRFGSSLPGPIYEATRNLVAHEELWRGEDFEAVMAEADLVLEGEYRTQRVTHCALEPHASLAYLDGYDRLNVVSSNQVPFHTRRQLALALGLPLSRVRIVKPRVGGGFGGKQEMLLEPQDPVPLPRPRLPLHGGRGLHQHSGGRSHARLRGAPGLLRPGVAPRRGGPPPRPGSAGAAPPQPRPRGGRRPHRGGHLWP
jgi:putative selenate reductase molybdopterin-binding subunit